MNRRGFALLAVLWLIVALGSAAAVILSMARIDIGAGRNRVTLRRSAWAREACLAILSARYTGPPVAPLDTVQLGHGTWCSASVWDPAGRVNINTADSATLRRLLRSDSMAAALMDWRDPDDSARAVGAEAAWYRAADRVVPRNGPLASTEELGLVRWFDDTVLATILPQITVNGSVLNVNSASAEVLEAISDLPPAATALLLDRRQNGRPIRNLDELMSQLAPRDQRIIASQYPELSRRLIFQSRTLQAEVTGGVAGYAPRSKCLITFVPLHERLAVVRRQCP